MKKKIRKKIIALCMITTMLISLCSCSAGGNRSREKERAFPKLVIGADNYEPFNYIGEDGEYHGIDVALAREACKRMGYQPEFRQIDWDQKDNILESETVFGAVIP